MSKLERFNNVLTIAIVAPIALVWLTAIAFTGVCGFIGSDTALAGASMALVCLPLVAGLIFGGNR